MPDVPTAAAGPAPAPHEHHLHAPPPFADPGKQERSARGIPVVPEFDGYRAFGIFAILATHLILAAAVVHGSEGDWGDRLMAGVGAWLITILFVVSGFVVFLPTVARGGDFGSIRGYAIRRAARLLPAYWLAMAIVLILLTVAGAPGPSAGELIVTFAGQDTWARLFDHSIALGFGIDGPVWSLTLEISFYILLPLIASAYCRRPLVGLAIAAAISIGWRFGFAHVSDLASIFGGHVGPGRAGELRLASYAQLPSWAFAFGAGMTGAWAYVNLPRYFDAQRLTALARWALLASIGVMAICAYLSGKYAIGGAPVAAAFEGQRNPLLFIPYVGAIGAAMLALSLSGWRSPFASPAVRKLGDLSYGVYLIQIPVVWALFEWTSLPHDGTLGALVLFTAIVVPVSVAYGYLSARLVEQPARRWARRFGRRAQAPPVTPSEASQGPPLAQNRRAPASGDA